MNVIYHPKVTGKNYDAWTKLMLSELYSENRDVLFEINPMFYSVEQNKKANDLIISTLGNEIWCDETLKKMTKDQFLKWRDNMIRGVHDSICFSEGFILSFYRWNAFFKVLDGMK